jgi:hypothetical protein
MGINAQRETEDGEALETVLDPRSLFERLLPLEREAGACLRFIDPYGDTTFNQKQIPFLVEELKEAINRASDNEAKVHGRKVLALIEKAEHEPHVYIKFIGD